MFEFNREFIINNNVGPLTIAPFAGKRFGYDNVAKVLKVGKMINIEAAKVHSIHRAPYYPEVSEVVTLPLTVSGTNVLNGTLVVTIAQEGRLISLVSDRLAEHTKDYIFNGTPADWVNQFNRQAAMEDMDRLLDMAIVGGALELRAKDCYTRIVKVVYDAANGAGIEPSRTWNRVTTFQSLITSSWTGALVPGTEGMGTVTRILKNMRLQTNAHLSAHGFDMDERPLPGGKYEQWTIQYVSERRHQSGEVFGSINHSLVTLIFFVEDGAMTDWLAAIGQGGAAANAADTASGLAGDAGVAVCDIAQPSTATGNITVDTDGDGIADADPIPGDQYNIPTAAAVPVVEAKEPVATEAKKHKA